MQNYYNTVKILHAEMEDITHEVDLNYKHTENEFPEFDREPLIPHMTSTEGPALAVADINHDGLDDVFIGAPKEKNLLFLCNHQQVNLKKWMSLL